MIYIQLFYLFFKIGILGFGGGYSIYSLMQYEIVEHYQWLTSSEFSDLVALSQITPGPVSINCATYIGYHIGGGIPGALLATFSLCLPSLILMAFVMRFLFKYKENQYIKSVLQILKPIIAGLILSAGCLIIPPDNILDAGTIFIASISFVGFYFTKLHPITILGCSAILGVLIF